MLLAASCAHVLDLPSPFILRWSCLFIAHTPRKVLQPLHSGSIGILCPYKGNCEHQPFMLVLFSFRGNDSRFDFWPLDGGRGPVSLGPRRKTIILRAIKIENRGKIIFFPQQDWNVAFFKLNDAWKCPLLIHHLFVCSYTLVLLSRRHTEQETAPVREKSIYLLCIYFWING